MSDEQFDIEKKKIGKLLAYAPDIFKYVGNCAEALLMVDKSQSKEKHNPEEIRQAARNNLFGAILKSNTNGNGVSLENVTNVLWTQIKGTLGYSAEELLDINKENFIEYAEDQIEKCTDRFIELASEMKESANEGQYKSELIEEFAKIMEVKRFDSNGKLTNYDPHSVTSQYVNFGFDVIIGGLLTHAPNNPESICAKFFTDNGLKHYKFLINFVQECAPGAGENMYARLLGQLEQCDGIIKERGKQFAEFMREKQEGQFNAAMEAAEKADPNCEIYLKNYAGLSSQYSHLLGKVANDPRDVEKDILDVKSAYDKASGRN